MDAAFSCLLFTLDRVRIIVLTLSTIILIKAAIVILAPAFG